MVCLTSCVFRSIRFSGFARPHFGVRREGELYTRLQAGGKRSIGSTRDAHKSGKNSSLGAFPGLGGQGTGTRADLLGAQSRSLLPNVLHMALHALESIRKLATGAAYSLMRPHPFVASCFRALALLAEPAKKEEGAQA